MTEALEEAPVAELSDYRPHRSGIYVPATSDAPTEPIAPVTDPAATEIAEVPAQAGRVDESGVWGREAPDVASLASAVRTARAAVELQDSEELFTALSARELQAEQDYARKLRADEREHAYQARKADLEDAQARAAHERTLRARARADEAADVTARYAYRRITSPTGDLARLNRARLWVPMLALLPAVFAVVLGAANVGGELDRLSPVTSWINWAISPIFTVPVFAVLLAQLAGFTATTPQTEAERSRFAGLKAGLLAIEVGLNVVPHYLGPAAAGGAGAWVFGLVPLGLAVSMIAAPKLRGHLTDRFITASRAAWDATSTPDRNTPTADKTETRPDLHRNKTTTPARSGAREPERKTVSDHREAFARLVADGRIDPARDSVNEIRKVLRTRKATAQALIEEWRHDHH